MRRACVEDVPGINDLARHLDSVNLPHDEAAIGEIVQASVDSFAGKIDDPALRRYMFVLHDLEQQRVVGTSMIVAQLGRRDAPYVYFQVRPEERYSKTLDRHFEHTVLRMAYSYQGPTEIGGLVMDPGYRSHPSRLGKRISFVRFLFIAARPELFQDELLAELMPPLLPDGTSHLWEAVGRRFTGLDYRTADRLSRENKEFIRGLFPDGDIYATLLAAEARAVIGEVGESTRAVARMLTSIGFRYAARVDPFDGGPHFLARRSDVHTVRAARERIAIAGIPPIGEEHLVGVLTHAPPWLRVRVSAELEVDEGDRVVLSERLLSALGAEIGDRVWIA
ncbi:MAG: arginine N-succinyltransferase, partial [Polyangiaceae bacterium]|nr:arginine N-succinyltransferase [Polyangiaceae bacterium]